MNIYPASFTRKPPMTRDEAEMQVARILSERGSVEGKKHILGMGVRVGNLSDEAKRVYASALAKLEGGAA